MKWFVKLISLVLMVCVLTSVCLAECVGLPNPIVELPSMAVLEEATGCIFAHPAVMGVTDEAYLVINGRDYVIGEYNFLVNGVSYSLRASQMTTEDISGVYVGEGTAFSEEREGTLATCTLSDAKLARWFNSAGQYVLYVQDNGEMDAETFLSVVEEMMTLVATER